MATVNVTSWAEFVAAVAVAGDTVVCPADAVWDLTEAEPITEPLEIACSEIQGNGTTITGATFNISGYSIRNTNSLTVDALHLENIYAECREYWWRASADLNFSKSKASGQFINTSYYDLFVFAGDSGKKTNFTSCAMNVSCPNGGNLILGNNPNYGVSKFCRYRLFTTNSRTWPFMYAVSPFNYCEKCELILSAPNASRAAFELDNGTFKTSGCVIRGTTGATEEYNLPTWDYGYHNWLNVASTSLGCKATVGTQVTNGGIFCTDSQMRNAEYLAQFVGYDNARFPLGDGDEDWHTGDIEWNGGYPYIPKMIDLPHLVLRPVPQNPYITVFSMSSEQSLLQNGGNGLAILTPTSCEVTEELNGTWAFSMQHPIDPEGKWEYLKLRNILKIAGQLFTILTVEVNYDNGSGYVTCTGEHIWYQLADGWIFPGDIISAATGDAFIVNASAQTVTFNTELASLVYTFEGHSDIIPTAPIVKDRAEGCTLIDALIGSGGLVDQSDAGYAELYRDNFNYSINNRMEGALENAFDIRIGRDLKGIRRTFDTTEFVSYFGCYDKWGNYFAVAWVLNQFMRDRNFPHHIVRTKTFSEDGLDVWEFGFAPLIAKGMAFFRRNCKPIIGYEIDLEDVRNNPDFEVMHLDRLKVGDSGTIYDSRLGGALGIRISGTVYDAIRDKVTRVTIGDKASFSAPSASTVEIEPEVVGGELYIQDGDGMFIEDGDGKLIYQEVIGDA